MSQERVPLPHVPDDVQDIGLDLETPEIAIRRTRVMGLHDAAMAARLPFAHQATDSPDGAPPTLTIAAYDDPYEVLARLSGSAPASGHDKALAAVTVTCQVTAPRYWWHELATYHFVTGCGSTSTMHTLRAEMGRVAAAPPSERTSMVRRLFSPHTPPSAVEAFLETALRDPPLHELKAALPEGLWMTQALVTNYRQLRTIRRQRVSHRLPEWRAVCRWIDGLPLADRLLRGGESGE